MSTFYPLLIVDSFIYLFIYLVNHDFIVNRCKLSNYFQCIYDSANLFLFKRIKVIIIIIIIIVIIIIIIIVENAIDDKENESEGTPSSNPQHDDETYVQNSFGSNSKYRKLLGIK